MLFSKQTGRILKRLKSTPIEVYLYILTLFIISFLPFILAQRGGNLIISVFNGFEYQTFDEFVQVWHKAFLGGYTVLLTPQLIFAFLLFKIFPAAIANIITMGSIKFLASIAIFYLLGNFTMNNKIKVIGSLFYLLSIYGQAIVENTPSGGYLFYAVLPLILYLFLTIRRDNAPRKLIAYTVAIFLITDTNFTYLFYLFLFLFIYAMYSFFILKEKIKMIYFFVFAAIFVGVSLYYYLPLLAYNYLYRTDIVSSNLLAESATWKSGYSSPSEIFRLMGSLDFYDNFKIGRTLYYVRPFFLNFIHNNLNVVISYAVSIFAITGLSLGVITKSKNIGKGSLYLMLFLFFFFLSVGAHDANPFQIIYQLLSKKILFFAIFRDPYKSVSILNLLYTIGVVYLLNRLISYSKVYAITSWIFILGLVVLSASYFTGGVFNKSEMIHVPQYVYDFGDWNRSNLNLSKEKKLLLPHQPFPILYFAKYPEKGSPIYYQVLDSTAVQSNAQFTPYIDQIQSLVKEPSFTQIVGFYNMPYIILSKDFNSNLYNSISPEIISPILNKTSNRVASFGSNQNITVYKVNTRLVNNAVYLPQRIKVASNAATINNIINLQQVFSGQNNNEFAFGTREDLKEIPAVQAKSLPSITVTRKNNVDFEVTVHNMTDDFLLVFNEMYNKGWVVKDRTDALDEIPFRHVQINGFTNGYWIDRANVSKYLSRNQSTLKNEPLTFTFHLYFQPQIYFYLGLTISGLTFLAVLIYFISWKLRRV